jgi:hypothetical protein
MVEPWSARSEELGFSCSKAERIGNGRANRSAALKDGSTSNREGASAGNRDRAAQDQRIDGPIGSIRRAGSQSHIMVSELPFAGLLRIPFSARWRARIRPFVAHCGVRNGPVASRRDKRVLPRPESLMRGLCPLTGFKVSCPRAMMEPIDRAAEGAVEASPRSAIVGAEPLRICGQDWAGAYTVYQSLARQLPTSRNLSQIPVAVSGISSPGSTSPQSFA